jgi:hypothetical protein
VSLTVCGLQLETDGQNQRGTPEGLCGSGRRFYGLSAADRAEYRGTTRAVACMLCFEMWLTSLGAKAETGRALERATRPAFEVEQGHTSRRQELPSSQSRRERLYRLDIR